MAAQLMVMNGASCRGLWSWSARANSSLPVPDSPCSSTVARVGATVRDDFHDPAERFAFADQRAGGPDLENLAAEGLVLAPKPHHLEGLMHRDLERLAPDRLGQIVDGARLDRDDRVLDARVAGHDDDRDPVAFLLEQAQQVQAREVGHPVVGHDEVERRPGDRLHRFIDARHQQRPVADLGEGMLQDHADGGLVVDAENGRHRLRRGGRSRVCGGFAVREPLKLRLHGTILKVLLIRPERQCGSPTCASPTICGRRRSSAISRTSSPRWPRPRSRCPRATGSPVPPRIRWPRAACFAPTRRSEASPSIGGTRPRYEPGWTRKRRRSTSSPTCSPGPRSWRSARAATPPPPPAGRIPPPRSTA